MVKVIPQVETLTGGTADRFHLSGGPGVPIVEETAAQVKTRLDLSGTNSGDQDLSSYATTAAVAAGYQPIGSYAASVHTHSIADVTGLQSALDGKQVAGSYAASTHTHAASDVTSGTFDNARIAQGNVTQHQAAITLTERQIVFLSTPSADASAALGVVEFNFPEAVSLSAVKFACDSDNPPTGSAAQMDIRLAGTTIFSTNPTIDAGENSSDTAATASVLSSSPTAISAGAKLEFDLDQIGASNAGRGYYAVLIYTRSNV